jgi:hypothetical protein
MTVSMTDGSLSRDGTAMAALPFSNSIGFHPARTKNTHVPFGCALHHGNTRCFFSTISFSPLSLFPHARTTLAQAIPSRTSAFAES